MSDPTPPVPPLPPGQPPAWWIAPAEQASPAERTAPTEQAAAALPPYARPPEPAPPQWPGYAASGYAPPAYVAPNHSAPAYSAPTYAGPTYAAPAYAAPYAAPGNPQYAGAVAYAGPAQAAPAVRGLGAVALVLALVVLVASPIVAGIAAFQIGLGIGEQFTTIAPGQWEDLSFLTPVREWVLLLEIAFWAGTVLGMWAIVQGVVAIVKSRGRALGIAAVILAVIAPIVFFFVAYAFGIGGMGLGSTMSA